MVRFKSNTRLSSIKTSVILTQTDTTVGFVSQNHEKLANIKSRPASKPFIKVFNNFKTFLACGNRIPSNKKNLVRRSKKTTFIVNNRAFRITPQAKNSQILRELIWSYSTSANESNKNFDREFCEDKADIIIEDKNRLYERSSSTLLKINNNKKVRIR
ncbi:MAG: hypothetical protein U9Q29_04740 [Campylobacterota bacterium]|nr:hypothetical protein [Campylobacterota bacterium]